MLYTEVIVVCPDIHTNYQVNSGQLPYILNRIY